MKECTKCRENKDEEEFRFRNKKNNIRTCWCKKCYSQYEKEKWATSKKRRDSNKEKNKKRRIRNAIFIWDFLLKNPCIECGEKDPVVLQFDHLDPSVKSFNISDMTRWSYSINRIEEEMKKCNVLCANCHLKKTAKQMGWHKHIINR